MKQINVLGLVSLDTLQFENGKSYLGGGAFATAWIASLWGVHANLYSTSYNKEYDKIVQNNMLWNAELFSHMPLATSKPMTRFEISRSNEDYSYKIFNMNNSQVELKRFLYETKGEQYIKLPAGNFLGLSNMISQASMNPQGKFDLIQFMTRLHTDGYIFLNNKELLSSSKLDFASTLKYIENMKQSFVITLGANGAICYDAYSCNWCYSSSIQTLKHVCTLGCGDAFAGGFLAAQAKRKSISECMLYGTISAYLLTYSPSNMPTIWLDNSTGYEYWESDLEKMITYFQNVDDLIEFIETSMGKRYTLQHNISLSKKFDWELY